MARGKIIIRHLRQLKRQSTSVEHFVLSAGYPFDIKNKKFTIKLGVPADMQAVRLWSNNSNHGPEQYFTDKYNDELGRWFFGNPTDPSDNGSGYNEISVLAISKSWLAANLSKDLASDSEFTTGYKINTPADKQKFLTTLKSDTSTCVKDAKKGFTASDNSLNICYTLNFGREGYNPQIIFSGYGEKDTIPMLLTGIIKLSDSTPMVDRDAEQKAISDANAGKYTAHFSASLKSLLGALKQTTLTVTDNTTANGQ
jgi:hypothetical protein